MRQEIRAGGALDILTKSELDLSMGHHFDAAIRDLLRGVDFVSFSGQGNGTGTFTIPYNAESGYTWSVKLVSAQLSAAGELSIYPASSNTVAPLKTVAAVANGTLFEAVATWGSNQAVLKDGRQITLYSATAVINNYLLMAEQVPTEMQGKL
jgi:hypothetical protein